ncbi:hypothetical protein OG548_05315 [Streptomyces sp. NBC_01356]|uniref:hypothetical protein n=1 Tax=Streptomyces sp. NBC_01356 TaxID=2903836 RepID=UPI002E2FF3B7|nr:hypothetical protein [Streptomyces sp. NBC_01356]
MHRITLWSALVISAIGLVVCYMVNASGLTYNPAVPTDNDNEQGTHMPAPGTERK